MTAAAAQLLNEMVPSLLQVLKQSKLLVVGSFYPIFLFEQICTDTPDTGIVWLASVLQSDVNGDKRG